MDNITVQPRFDLVPWNAKDLILTAHTMAEMITTAAAQELRQELDTFDKDYNGAEREAIIAQRALQKFSTISMAMDETGAVLIREMEEKGPYHPDLHGNVTELIDEIVSATDQHRCKMMQFMVEEVFTKAEEYGVDLQAWLSNTTTYKLIEVEPEFRSLMGDTEMPEDIRKETFDFWHKKSQETITAIREARMLKPPQMFMVYQKEVEGGVEWTIPWIEGETATWALRQLAPYARKEEI